MGEEVRMIDYDDGVSGGDEERVMEWEDGLPNTHDLTPLATALIPPELASAFSITPEPCKSMNDVNRASSATLSSLRRQSSHPPLSSSCNLKSLPCFGEDRGRDPVVVEGDEQEEGEIEPGSLNRDGSEARKIRRRTTTTENAEEANSGVPNDSSNDDHSARTLKRPRLVWTPQLHKRFVDVVAHLGIKSAVPKTIMQLMNVEGLTRENVASHLQKYRLYLKRMQGLSNEGPSSSDQLFASTPVPQSLHESGGQGGHMPIQMPMPPPPQMMHMPPVIGVPPSHGHMGMPVGNPSAYHGFEQHHFNMYREQQRDLSANKYGSFVSHSHVAPNSK
ncbi:hypothetical protein Scep_015842 [Stephania cephalantha]|uniref:HTH myb-type domain-containing protein n=1 Tax=Stephania cephalantha TaxID=152367 RepID=A0AAP0J3Q4_9MAGN